MRSNRPVLQRKLWQNSKIQKRSAEFTIIAAAVGIALSMNNNNNSDQGIEYLANEGKQSTTGLTSVYDKSSTIPDLKFEKNDCTFVGYTVSSDGTGTVYKIGDAVPDVKKLYAKYEFNTKIKVYINDIPDTLKVMYNGNVVTSGQEFTSSDCSFSFVIVGDGVSYTFHSSPNNNFVVKEDGFIKFTAAYTCETYEPSESLLSGGDMDETHYPIDTKQKKSLTISFSEAS